MKGKCLIAVCLAFVGNLSEARISEVQVVPGFALTFMYMACSPALATPELGPATDAVESQGFEPIESEESFYSIRGSAYRHADFERFTPDQTRYVIRLIYAHHFYFACEMILDRMDEYGETWTVNQLTAKYGPPISFSASSAQWSVEPWTLGLSGKSEECWLSFDFINVTEDTGDITVLRLSEICR